MHKSWLWHYWCVIFKVLCILWDIIASNYCWIMITGCPRILVSHICIQLICSGDCWWLLTIGEAIVLSLKTTSTCSNFNCSLFNQDSFDFMFVKHGFFHGFYPCVNCRMKVIFHGRTFYGFKGMLSKALSISMRAQSAIFFSNFVPNLCKIVIVDLAFW